jgi:hypothetical protein
MASLYSEQRDKGPGYILDTNWKIFSTARERQRAMLEAGWIPMCATGATTPHIKWQRVLPGGLKQMQTFACTPSDVRHWMHEQSNLQRQDRDAVEELGQMGLEVGPGGICLFVSPNTLCLAPGIQPYAQSCRLTIQRRAGKT